MSMRKDMEKAVSYLKDDNLSKLKSCIRKHNLNVNQRLKGGLTLLHIACSMGHEACMRYLLRRGSDVLLCDKEGNTPLHMAVFLALKGNKYAYTDLVLPLIKEDLELLDCKNNKGQTCRQLLQDIKERLQRENMEEDREHTKHRPDIDAKKQWNEKLFEEMAHDMNEEHKQDHLYDDNQQESFKDWSERIGRERSHKRRQNDENPTKKEAKRKKKEEDSRAYTRKLHKEHEKYYEKLQAEKISQRLNKKKEAYESDCVRIFSANSTEEISFQNLPWPDKASIDKGIEVLVHGFANKESDEFKKYLKEQQVRWHPDRFMQKCGERLRAEDKDRILEIVNTISQALNSFIQ